MNTKTLSINIQDINLDDNMSVSGTLDPNKFNETVIISIGQVRFAVNSKLLAQALADVVAFQTPDGFQPAVVTETIKS